MKSIYIIEVDYQMKYLAILLFLFLNINISYSQDIDILEVKLDSVINLGIDSMAFPGAQLVIARKDTILLQKSYGFHTYDKKTKVENNQLYDLASITKVTTGLLLLMRMVDAGLIDLDIPVAEYLPVLKKSNKSKITLRQVLSHQAGLKPYIVFWSKTLRKNGKFKWWTFKHKYSKRYPIKITENLYLHRRYRKKMVAAIKKSPVTNLDSASYKYSGLLFLLLPELIENVLKSDFQQQLKLNIYDKLELDKMTYNPLSKFDLSEIVPTEIDTVFRKCLVHGYVHDEAAAMLNSHSCNAGLFSNAENLARVFQMLLNDGNYRGKSILSKEVIKEFSSYQYPQLENRRGLGFDKPLLSYDADKAYISKQASSSSFGHSGFTGTFVWADPDKDFIIVLLTNRVYPYRSQRKLYSLNIRPTLHDLCYKYLSE